MKLRLCMIFAFLSLFVGLVQAQTVVSGTVTSSEDGEPVIGASVMIKGTQVGAATDYDGNFSITTQVKNPQGWTGNEDCPQSRQEHAAD